ncbi:hypothetical protein TWF694_002617 [Orbilia ellipsospora]|uniref:GPI anchored protein n=1 Tax=Orbilia ellipsospora TaxID=2528407 RepID=A0AAV9X2M4_9PEZI
MRIPTLSIAFLSISLLPFVIADTVDVPPGKVKDETPGELLSTTSKRSLLLAPRLEIPENQPKSLPRWLPRKIKTRQEVTASGNRASGLICVKNGPSCGSGAFCNSGLGCCLSGQQGCGGNSCCSQGESCCSAGGGCCPSGYDCVTVNGNPGCCLQGTDCTGAGDLVDSVEGTANPNDGGVCKNDGFGVCPSRQFCCPSGRKCLRDAQGRPACERVCEDSDFFVCPTNDFCCPSGSTCFIDSSGKNRCRVTIVTTITSTPATSTSSSDSTTITLIDVTTTSSSSETTTTASSTTDSSTDTTATATSTGSSSSDVSSTTTGAAATSTSANNGQNQNTENGPLPPPNGDLSNVFTNSAVKVMGAWVPATTALTVGLVGLIVGWL